LKKHLDKADKCPKEANECLKESHECLDKAKIRKIEDDIDKMND